MNQPDANEWYKKGKALFEAGEYKAALAAFEKAIALDPNYAAPWKGKGNVLDEMGEYAAALAAYEEAIKIDPNLAAPWNGRGNVLRETGEYATALAAFEKAIALDPNYAAPWKGKGNVLDEMGEYAAALAAYEEAIKIDPNLAAPWNGKGNVLRETGEYATALAAYEEAIKIDPNLAAPWHGKGNVLRETGEYAAALAAYEEAIKIDPNLAAPWHGKGNVLYEMGEYAAALAAYEEAIKIDPNFALPWNGKGNVLYEMGKYATALAAYEEAIKIDPNYALPWNGKGDLLRKTGEYAAALAAYEEAIKIDPNFAFPWNGKGDVYITLENFSMAIGSYYRFSYLAKPLVFFKAIPQLLRKFHETFSAPMFIYRIFREYPALLTHVSWMKLADETFETCEPLMDILTFVSSSQCDMDEIDSLKLSGLIYFYMGDPMEAYRTFDKLDDINENDLMGQYYLVESMKSFFEPHESALNFAVQHADEFMIKSDKKDVIGSYYAGHIYYLRGDYDTSAAIFNMIRKFLPAHYMEIACCHQMERFEERDGLIYELLKRESEISKQGQEGFLERITPQSIDLRSSDWDKPFYKYTHSREISEGIGLVYEYLEKYEERHGEIPEWLRFIDSYDREESRRGFESWRLVEDCKTEMRQYKMQVKVEGLTGLFERLHHYFPDIPRFEEFSDETAVESAFLQLIDKYSEWENLEKYQLLAEYLFHADHLGAQNTIVLNFYVYLKWAERCQNSEKSTAFNKAMDDAVKSAVGTIIGSTVLQSIVSLPLSAFTAGVGAGFVTLLLEYLKNEVKGNDNENQLPDYASFKSGFIRYISELMDDHEDMFYSRYPMFNYENWMHKQDLG